MRPSYITFLGQGTEWQGTRRSNSCWRNGIFSLKQSVRKLQRRVRELARFLGMTLASMSLWMPATARTQVAPTPPVAVITRTRLRELSLDEAVRIAEAQSQAAATDLIKFLL
jgi:hypothetical protein